jgi:S-formylglutathione hydrolase
MGEKPWAGAQAGTSSRTVGVRYSAHAAFGELRSDLVPEAVPYAVVTPQGGDPGPFPLCVVLHGGGGSRQSLADCGSLFENWWSDGSLPPMVLASPSAGLSYYVEDAAASVRWDAFIAESFVGRLRATCNIRSDRSSTVITGMSMGGYGALKIAFAYPELFSAVAAMEAVLEPGLRDDQITARNRLHHGSGGPARLIGPHRDPDLFAANNPANRAMRNAARIREHDLAIYIEAGDHDFINVHDGAEFLHRVLWDLDISHEYRLTRGADHVGPTLTPRMREMYLWLGRVLHASSRPEARDERIEGGAVSPSSQECVRLLRAQMEPVRKLAAASDATTNRRYGVLAATRPVSG